MRACVVQSTIVLVMIEKVKCAIKQFIVNTRYLLVEMQSIGIADMIQD